ncbi:MAG: GNAT family N-acetyltransferase [Planctomycetota bacterium]|nr:GNAT family N-acetyltransferase [Planctomycetota bacterium]
MTPAIRPATRDDAPLLLGLIQQAFQTSYDRLGLAPENYKYHASFLKPAWILEQMDAGNRFFVLEDAGEAVGCVALKPEEDGAVQMRRLAVLPAHRGKGYGRRLVDHVLAEARAMGARRATLGMWSADVPLRQWYERLGFAVTETKTYPDLPLPVTHMAMNLGGAAPTEPRP